MILGGSLKRKSILNQLWEQKKIPLRQYACSKNNCLRVFLPFHSTCLYIWWTRRTLQALYMLDDFFHHGKIHENSQELCEAKSTTWGLQMVGTKVMCICLRLSITLSKERVRVVEHKRQWLNPWLCFTRQLSCKAI